MPVLACKQPQNYNNSFQILIHLMKTQANCQIVIQLQKLLSNPGAT